jgi:hypothetical protein
MIINVYIINGGFLGLDELTLKVISIVDAGLPCSGSAFSASVDDIFFHVECNTFRQ